MKNDNIFIANVERNYPDYLHDESRLMGRADSISFPKTEEEIKEHCEAAHRMGRTITVQGARTGITGGAVPEGGHILNLSRMNKAVNLRWDASSEEFFLTVQPGVLLSRIQEALKKKEFDWGEVREEKILLMREEALKKLREKGEYFFPPDVTESSATIGGMTACNASGAESFYYGSTRKYVESLRMVLADGDVLPLKRVCQRAKGRYFSLQTSGGRLIEGKVPLYEMPMVKNASGYFAEDDMDLVDLFVGSEGTLAVISEVEIRLVPEPPARWSLVTFFPSEEASLSFVKKVRESENRPVAIEFFDSRSLKLFRDYKRTVPAFSGIPDMPECDSAIYLEFHGKSEEAVENAAIGASEIVSMLGGNSDAIWLACSEKERTRLKDFRHAVSEAVNMLIDERRRCEPGITKLGTDMAVPDGKLREVMALYHRSLGEANLEYVIFGHIGNNHLHVNIIPASLEKYHRGKELYLKWADKVLKMGGTVSAEHGIGKIKTAFLRRMYGEEDVRQMLEVKKLFDPENILNPGNLFGKS